MKILVLVQGYPDNNGNVASMFVHNRNLMYIKNGYDVTVLNFATKNKYKKDGIEVLSETDYYSSDKKFDLLIIHASNVRNHYRFLRKNSDKFKKIIFFYHGHEVLKLNEAYPDPFPYIKRNKIKENLQNAYDNFKLKIWRNYLPKIKDKSSFVFVSNWIKDEFFKNTKLNRDEFEDSCYVINNCVGEVFERETFDDKCEKKYDFITIRSNLDGSKYCVDLVNELAKNTPDAKFLLVGKGEYFNHYKKSENIEWINNTLSHNDMINYLQNSKFALMPTREDTQGLMTCEMAAFGMPVITSDIKVCREIFDGFNNAYLIDNDNIDTLDKFKDYDYHTVKDTRYYKEKTMKKELDLIAKNIK